MVKCILGFTFAALVGCATPVHKSFSRVKIGDDKAAVLEILGSPKHTVRRDGKDFWVYRFYREGVEYKRSITFESSKVSAIGQEEIIMDPREALIEKDLESMTPETFREKK